MGKGSESLDAAGNLYIADSGNNRIRRVDTSSIISTVAGNGVSGHSGDGGSATNASLNYPYGVAVDGSGSIYVLDAGNKRVQVFGSLPVAARPTSWGRLKALYR